jgi:hypothetical protein
VDITSVIVPAWSDSWLVSKSMKMKAKNGLERISLVLSL